MNDLEKQLRDTNKEIFDFGEGLLNYFFDKLKEIQLPLKVRILQAANPNVDSDMIELGLNKSFELAQVEMSVKVMAVMMTVLDHVLAGNFAQARKFEEQVLIALNTCFHVDTQRQIDLNRGEQRQIEALEEGVRNKLKDMLFNNPEED